MILRKEHALALERLLQDQEAQRPFTEISEADVRVYRELERANLVRQLTPTQWVPTYLGTGIAHILRELYQRGPQAYHQDEGETSGPLVIREAYGLAPPETWPDDWRWVGSEIIAMLDAARRANRVGPLALHPLMERGFAARVWDREAKRERVVLTEYGRRLLEIYEAATPRLVLDDNLAEFIRRVPLGPAPASRLPTGSHEEHLLEAMRLIAYSVPQSDIYTFTALGQAIQQVLKLGCFVQGTVLSEDLLWALVRHVDGETLPPEALAALQARALIDHQGELLPAGEWALEAFRLWHDGARKDVWSFAITAEEAEVLKTIQSLWERYRASGNEEDLPTFKRLRREMIDRKVHEYKALLERYGRRLQEMPKKYREIAQRFQEAKDLARWYDDNFMLREALYSLESFQLIRTEVDAKGRDILTLTPFGEQVAADQQKKERDISSTAVKAITMTRKTFSAPNVEWVEEAQQADLLGTAEPTKAGYLYAHLAEGIRRLPHLTRFELEVFHVLPAQGMTVEEVYEHLKAHDPEKVRWALEKLEARHLIEILPDGNIVETEAGKKLDEALAGVPTGFGNPVNPLMVRVLQALKDAGTLYIKEQKVRILPRNIEKALKASGLSKEDFQNALEAARVAGYVGRTSLTKAALALLEVVEHMNPSDAEVLHGYRTLYEAEGETT